MSEAGGAIRSIKIVWDLVDRVTAPARKIDAEVDKMMGQGGEVAQKYQETTTTSSNKVVQAYQNAETAVGRYTGGLKSRLTGAAKAIEDHQMAIAGIGAALAGVGYLGLNYYKDGTEGLATYMSAHDALYSKMGADTDAYIQQLKEASGYQLTDTEIVTKANMAMMLGIPEDALPTMSAMARAAGRQLEGDVSYYYESIMTGTARESKLWLDNLGIIVNVDEARQNYAKTLGISADAMTTEQEKLAFINEVLAHSDDLLKDVDFTQNNLKETLNRSTTSWENLQRELTEGALPAISATADANAWLADTLNAMPGPMKTIVGTGGLVLSTLAGITGALLLQLAAISLIIPAWGTYKAQLLTYVPATISAAIATGTLSGALGVLGVALWGIAMNPITWVIIAIVGAIWLLWDTFSQPWEETALCGAINWMFDTFPWLAPLVDGIVVAVTYLRESLAGVWSYLEPIVDSITRALENPYVKLILDAMWAVTPMGVAENAWAIATGEDPKLLADIKEISGYPEEAYRQDVVNRAYANANRGTTINHIAVDASMNTGDLKTEGVTKEDLNSLMNQRDKKVQSGMEKMIKGELSSVGAGL